MFVDKLSIWAIRTVFEPLVHHKEIFKNSQRIIHDFSFDMGFQKRFRSKLKTFHLIITLKSSIIVYQQLSIIKMAFFIFKYQNKNILMQVLLILNYEWLLLIIHERSRMITNDYERSWTFIIVKGNEMNLHEGSWILFTNKNVGKLWTTRIVHDDCC